MPPQQLFTGGFHDRLSLGRLSLKTTTKHADFKKRVKSAL